MIGRQFLVVMLLSSSIFGVLAQSDGGDGAVVHDSSGDAFDPVDTGLSDDAEQRFAAMDLVSLSLDEDEEQIRFRIHVVDISADSQTPFLGEGTIQVAFSLGPATVTYVPITFRPGQDEMDGDPVTMDRDRFRVDLTTRDGSATARLMQYDIPRGEYVPVYESCPNLDCLNQVDVDAENNAWTVHLSRSQLQDTNGGRVSHRLPLHSFLITSEAQINGMSSGVFEIRDVMPDDGVPAGEFVSQFGALQQAGHIRLQADVPVRWSNGGVTDYVYRIQVANNKDTPDTILLDVPDAPMGWNVTLGAKSLALDANTVIDIPVRLSTQSLHRHGSYDSFIVHARSAVDPDAQGLVELGLRYSDVPQPAGHHPRLWIHAEEAFQEDEQTTEQASSTSPVDEGPREAEGSFMSTVPPEDMPGSDPDAVILADEEFSPYLDDDYVYMWFIDLAPSLKMGLDFDLNRTGEVEIPFIASGRPVMDGDLYLRKPSGQPLTSQTIDRALRLGTFRATENFEFDRDRPSTVHATFQPLAGGDYVPFRPEGAHLYLVVRLTYPSGEVDAFGPGPQMVPGARLSLPLDEYHDPTEGVAGPVNDPALGVFGTDRKMANSGESVLFDLRLKNVGPANERFALQSTSLGAEWVTILGGSVVDVPSDGSHDVQVLVTIPPGESSGLVVGPLIEAVSLNDPQARAETRIFVEVDDQQDHPDHSHLLPVEDRSTVDAEMEARGTPLLGPWASWFGLGLAVAAFRRTRRL